MKIFSKFVFVAVSGVFLSCAAWAQCCECEPDDGCPLGQDFDYQDPSTLVIYCSDSCNYDCDQYCDCASNFNDECPSGTSGGVRCKIESTDCDGISGCTKYALCSEYTGAPMGHTAAGNNCHYESAAGKCYGNTRACSEFNIDIWNGEWNCTSSDNIVGNAQWDSDANAWNTGTCECSFNNKQIDMDGTSPVKCDNANAHYDVASGDSLRTKTVNDVIHYTIDRQYCLKCMPGYLPYIEPATPEDLYLSPDNNSPYGVRKCSSAVVKPYYAPGCDLNNSFPFNNTTMPASCQVSCPTNMETLVNGAVSQDDCVPDNATVYQDSTGSFKLGTTQCQ